jgi:hypothetical protein
LPIANCRLTIHRVIADRGIRRFDWRNDAIVNHAIRIGNVSISNHPMNRPIGNRQPAMDRLP